MDKTYFNREKAEVRKSPFNIFINQAGYEPGGSKLAVMPFKCDEFNIESLSGEVLYKGKTAHFGYDACSADDIYLADFSDFAECGKFRISADGKISAAFEISEEIYSPVLNSLLKAFYYLRCGSGLEEKYAGVYKHEPCHTEKAHLWENRDIVLDVSGGWHDAGDYGRYVTAGACALSHILYAYTLFPCMKDISLDIPESGNGVPDILNECRYELEWILKMQREDGGVYHKVTTAMHAPFVMPEDDKAELFIFPVSSMAAADTAAVMALASRIYAPFDKEFSEKLKEAALLSYGWLKANPVFLGFRNPEGCNTGSYGEWEDRSNRFWAAAELFALTGEENYHSDIKMLLKDNFSRTGLGYGDVGGFGAMAYIFGAENHDEIIKAQLENDIKAEANQLKAVADGCGYGTAMTEHDYHWGSNMDLMKHGMIFIIADIISGENCYKDYILRQADYLLGLNALGISYVTGVGEYRCNYPHLRPAHADGIEECIPGMVSGGPNRTPNDLDAKILIPEGTPPMKCYADDVGCYSLNEITIYWNSPAVFVIAAIL